MRLKLLFIFLVSLILNLIWEYLNYPLYIVKDITINNLFFINLSSKFTLLVYASFIDAIIILFVYLITAILNKKINWKINLNNNILFSILAIIIAILIELNGIISGRWSYSSSMPVILRIGISPLLQLLTTGWITILLIKLILRK